MTKLVCAIALLLWASTAYADKIFTFIWDPPDPSFNGGYYIKWSTSPDLSNPMSRDVGKTIDPGDGAVLVPTGSTYYVFATAYLDVPNGDGTVTRLESP